MLQSRPAFVCEKFPLPATQWVTYLRVFLSQMAGLQQTTMKYYVRGKLQVTLSHNYVKVTFERRLRSLEWF